jgi:hypothetical protein
MDYLENGLITLEGAFLVERALAYGLVFKSFFCVPAREE